jgi:hypothetical protein
MKKIFLSLLSLVILLSLIFTVNLQPAFAAGANASITKSGKYILLANGDCYAYDKIEYTYTVYNTGDETIYVKSIIDDGITIYTRPTPPDKIIVKGGTPLTFHITVNVTDVHNLLNTKAQLKVTADNTGGILTKDSNLVNIPLPTISPIPSDAWFLNEIQNQSVPTQLEMELGSGQLGGVTLGSGGTQTWLSYPAAAAGVSFPAGTWTLTMHTPQDWGTDGSNLNAQIGKWSGSTFTSYGNSGACTWDDDNFILTVPLSAAQIDLIAGDYLALQITNTAGTHIVVTCRAVGGTYLCPPEGSPHYPVPELPALALLGLGLAGIGTFIVIRRKQGGSKTRV